jgi:hypothetical protein
VDDVVPRITSLEAPRRRWEYETEVIGNGGFSQWYGDAPKMWTPEPDASALRPTHDTPGGVTAIELVPPQGSGRGRVSQMIQLEPFFSGARIFARMQACAHEPRKCSLIVAVQPRGRTEPLVFSADHPGDGQWREVSVEAAIPADVNPQMLKVGVQLGAGATRSASATQVEVVLRK